MTEGTSTSAKSASLCSKLPEGMGAAENKLVQNLIADSAINLRVGGITPLTTIDFPNALSCVLFCQGCPWRCAYCHNPALLPARQPDNLLWETVEKFLQSRTGLLDAVVFSGGEPCAQTDLAAAMQRARALGFKIGLHTGGAYPERLKEVLALCDWVGFDIKTNAQAYADLTGAKNSADNVRRSLHALLDSGVDHEVRTTWHQALLSPDNLLQLAQALSEAGVRRYVVQWCLTTHGRAADLSANTDALSAERWLLQNLAPLFTQFAFRY